MLSTIQGYGVSAYSVPVKAREAKISFLHMAESVQQTGEAQADAYRKYLEKRFGPVTLESVGKDQESLDAAGKRMSGRDIVIAPNIFEEMVNDPEKAAYYEQKISYFFTDVIPKGQASAAAAGLTFEPCGVVIHEDGTVTYICGGGDTPERVAEVNRINRERDAKRAAEQRLYWAGLAATPASLMIDLAARSGQVQAGGAVEAPSLETMLQAKYPGLHYHVFDASSGFWRTRNDYPHYLLYQDGDKAKETLENWQPEGANPFYGSIDGRFTAPKELKALGSVPPGSKAVVIHPKVQERMEQDPAYAQEIFAKIDAWFAFDVARNEAILPGSTWDMSQAVAIGEDGNICNACSSSAGGGITFSRSGSDDDGFSWWDLRMARHAEFMKLLADAQDQLQASQLAASAAAKSRLADMLDNGGLPDIFGDTIAGIPTETILALTRSQVWGLS